MAKDRLVRSVSTTSDSQGRATFTLGPAEQGYVYEGSVQVPNAPAGALFVATVLTTNWGQWAGPTNYGPIQLYGGEYLTVTATGMNPSSAYVLTMFGIWGEEEGFDPKPPAAPMSVVSVETATGLVSGVTIAGSGGNITIRPPSLTRRLSLVIDGTNKTPSSGGVSVTGVQTGVLYGIATVNASANTTPPAFVAIEPAIDQTYKVQFDGAGSIKIWIVASFTNPLIETNPGSPLAIAGSSLPSPQPVVAVRPWEPFSSSFLVVAAAATANQQLIAAPAAGRSIYLQMLTIGNQGAAANGYARFHPAGGTTIVDLDIAVSATDHVLFPGGFMLPSATALQVDTFGATTIQATGTYSIAATQTVSNP